MVGRASGTGNRLSDVVLRIPFIPCIPVNSKKNLNRDEGDEGDKSRIVGLRLPTLSVVAVLPARLFFKAELSS